MNSSSSSSSVLVISVETMTGQQLVLHVDKKMDTVNTLKRRIWMNTGIPPYHQGIVLAGRELLHMDNTPLGEIFHNEDTAVIKLALLARTGPLLLNNDRDDDTRTADEDGQLLQAEGELEQEEEQTLDWTFNEQRRLEARTKADENRRTLLRMRELRKNMHDNKNNIGRMPPTPPSTSMATLCTPSRSSRYLLSAPEDTSAKESSAGETECEEWQKPACPVPIRDFVHRRELRLAGNTKQPHESAVAAASSSVVFVSKNVRPARPSQQRTTSLNFNRVPSSSSEPESAGAVWTTTGDEEDDDGACAAVVVEDDITEQRPLDDDPVEPLFGSAERSSPPLGKARCMSPAEHASDPSEMSSGMIICDLSNEFRRLKVRRKHHQTNGRGGGVNRGRTRSKPRREPIGGATGGAVVDIKSSTEVSSSEDERKKNKPFALCTVPVAVMNARKTMGGAYCRPAKRGFTDQVMAIRVHRQPQSSQSQQRCNACGYKLSISATFQCRCGKSLCSRHRQPELHMCTKLQRTVTSKMQDVSD